MAAESSSAAVILASSHLGFALSTTHVATGSILGSGVGKPGAQVRWGVAGRMVAAWLITLPAAGVVGAVMWFLGDLLGGYAGPRGRLRRAGRARGGHVRPLAGASPSTPATSTTSGAARPSASHRTQEVAGMRDNLASPSRAPGRCCSPA